ncbi:hypothetical protein [Robbsia andropogonis]|nr:hypothetical protein [Robbsia andropogonis]
MIPMVENKTSSRAAAIKQHRPQGAQRAISQRDKAYPQPISRVMA